MIKWEDYICGQYALGLYSPGYLGVRQESQKSFQKENIRSEGT